MEQREWLGKRVALNYGVLDGEPATVVANDEGSWWEMDGDDEKVRIRFDRHNAHLGSDKGYAILSDRWEYVENLRIVE